MRNSLLWKLTSSFMLVAIITAGLVALFIRLTSADRLLRLIVDQQRSSLQTSLAEYYQKNGSWNGVTEQWQQIYSQLARPPLLPTPPGLINDPFQPPPDNHQNFFGLADAQGKVVIPISPDSPIGSDVSVDILQEGTSILVDGKQMGTLLNAPLRPRFNPAENMFLQRTTEALIYTVLGAILVALIIGIPLARTLIRPLQALTQAVQNITQGELEQEVRVSSNDEIGKLGLAFNKMSHEVARVNQLRRQMTADIAHDLRTPLMVIAGYIESIQEGVLQPTPERLSLIYTEIERLQNLVGDLKMLSQADTGELPLNLQPISPLAFLERVVATYTHQAKAQNITLMVEAEGPLPEVRVDEDRMMQVFSNLLSNSLRYTPAGGNICLSAQFLNEKVILTVRDSGIGIPEEKLPNIFDRFYRVDESRTGTDETGLGLAIVKSLVKAHNGAIRVESNYGEYTAIHIDLPA
jgi:signal transduction histidine kinase